MYQNYVFSFKGLVILITSLTSIGLSASVQEKQDEIIDNIQDINKVYILISSSNLNIVTFLGPCYNVQEY